MKAIVLDRPGSCETLRIAEMPMPEPGPDEIRIRVAAAGLNPADYKHIETAMPSWRFPLVTGCDLAGTVDTVGALVETPRPGDRVSVKVPLGRLGAFAEYCTAPAFLAVVLPDGVSFIDAAALPTAGITAYQAVHRRLGIGAGDLVLVQGGAGGVGGFAIQFAARAGAEVTTTTSSRNAGYVKALGATHVIDYGSEDLAARAKVITGGQGYDAIVDTVGPVTAAAGFALLACNGGLACVGGRPAELSTMQRATSLHDIAVDYPFRTGSRRAQEDLQRMGAELVAMLARGELDAMVAETVPLREIPDALKRLAGRHVRGKIVATVD